MSLTELLTAVEAATGPDPRLDGELDALVGHEGEAWPARYTASLDAALALCTRVLPGWNWRVEHIGGKPHAAVWRDMGECGIADAGIPALALIAAMLQALISKSSESGEGDRASRGEGAG